MSSITQVPPSMIWLIEMIEKHEKMHRVANQYERQIIEEILVDLIEQKERLHNGK